jgi:erythromycin esterase-like protein
VCSCSQVYKEVDAIAAEKQRLEEAKKKEAENNEETKAARAAQVAAEARAAEEARLKMERHAAEEEKNAAERKLAARRAEIEKQVSRQPTPIKSDRPPNTSWSTPTSDRGAGVTSTNPHQV